MVWARRPGKSAGLLGALAESWGALEADFQRFYAIDLQAACFGPTPVPCARLTRLAANLPPEATSRRDAHGLNHPDRVDTALLNLGYVQYVALAYLVAGKKARPAKFRDFIPQPAEPPRERPTDFVGWARWLVPLAS